MHFFIIISKKQFYFKYVSIEKQVIKKIKKQAFISW